MGDESVVDECEDGGCEWAGGGGARDCGEGLVPEEGKVETLGCDVGVAAALYGYLLESEMRKVEAGEEFTWVVQALVLAIQRLDVCGNNLVLVRWSREIVAESTARSIETVGLSIESNTRLTESSNFRLELLGSSNSRDIWARGGESGEESAGVLSIIGEACGVVLTSKSTITARN